MCATFMQHTQPRISKNVLNVLLDVGALWTYNQIWNDSETFPLLTETRKKRVDQLSNAFTTLPLDSSINKFRRGYKNKLTKHRWCKISIKFPSAQSLSFIDIYTLTNRKTDLTDQSVCYSRRFEKLLRWRASIMLLCSAWCEFWGCACSRSFAGDQGMTASKSEWIFFFILKAGQVHETTINKAASFLLELWNRKVGKSLKIG